MSSFVRRVRELFAKYAHIMLIIFAFTLMVISSYAFISNMEHNHLQKYALNAIANIEVNIKSDLLEPESLLGTVSETIRDMIMQDKNIEEIHQYVLYINDYLRSEDNNSMPGVIGFYGVFDVYDGKFLSGTRGWVPPDDYIPSSRSWYSAALKANGSVCITQPYVDIYSEEVSITFARRIFDDEGSPLGIIGLDIMLDRIRQYAADTRYTDNGYGFILSEDFSIIAYPDSSKLGQNFKDVRSDLFILMEEYQHNGSLSGIDTTDYRGVKSIIYINRLYNGWYMGVATPRSDYYQSTRKLALILSALGAFFALLLIWILVRISRQKANSEGRMQLMFDATPLGVTFWDKNFNVIDCNQNALDMFGVSTKKEYIERFNDLSPEYQPDGVTTKELLNNCFSAAMKDGFLCMEWMHQTLGGEPLPCEVTLIRDKFKDDFIILGYTRDMREIKKMMKEIDQRARLLDIVNTAAAILLSGNDKDTASFERILLMSFDLIGRYLDVDRVHILRNEIIDEEIHTVLRYEWLSDYGKTLAKVPFDIQFPGGMKKRWEDLFLQGGHISAPLSELQDDEREFFGRYFIKSIIVIPMFLDGVFWGLFSIDDCRNDRKFSQDEVNIMTSAGLMMCSAVDRNIQNIKMRETDERMQIMINAAPICAIFWDNNLDPVDCNQEVANMFGLTDKAEYLEKFKETSPEYQPDGILSSVKGRNVIKKAMDEGYSRIEWMHQKLDGEQIPSEIICVRVKHKEEYTVIEYIRDLREQQAMIAEMRKAEIAEESSKAKSDFLARMSHEIRTPMNAILGIAEIQLQDQTLPQVTKEALDRIYNSGDLLLGIINDILDLSKIEAGKLTLTPNQYDIASLIHDTVQLNIMRYESKPIDFKLNVDENTPLLFIGDELRIKQILNNLLSNAFKYTDEGSVNLNISVQQKPDGASDEILKDENNVTLVFTISDTGQGMTSEQVSRLGNEYSRFNMEANRKTEGTGLGMNITRNLLHLMNGELQIESTPGVGSVFTVRLPQKCIDNEPIGKELANNLMRLNLANTVKIRTVQIKREFMPYGRVLIVDDVETNLYVAKGLMAPYGLSMDTVTSGFEAIERIKNGNVYDIIFMDHMMPKMDGIEAAKIIRNFGYTKPIVALTANALAGQAEVFLNSGFDDFISKPIDIRQLNIVLNKLIRDRTPPDVVKAARDQQERLYGSWKPPVDLQLAEFFIRDAKKTAGILEAIYVNKCRTEDDISMFIINVHAMKSALANVGESSLSAAAAKLEQAGRDKEVKVILSELPSFMEMLYAVIHKFEAREKKYVKESGGDNAFLKEELLKIKTACSEYNKKAAKNLLTEIRKKTWPSETDEWLGSIAGYLLHSEFDTAVKLIDEKIDKI